MTTLTILRGISGSGKSTLAEQIAAQTGAVIVSTDLIRLALAGDALTSGVDSQLFNMMEGSFISACLLVGRDVISDDCNIDHQRIVNLKKLASECGADVEIVEKRVSLETALKNNAHRAMLGGRHVPESIIKRQYRKFSE